MVAVTTRASLGQKAKVAVLQPLLKTAISGTRLRGRKPSRATSYADARNKLAEATALADTLGCEVVFEEVVPIRSIHPRYLFGSGKTAALSGAVAAAGADSVFVNTSLSGLQLKGLSEQWDGAAVLDRFRVILDIFADRARTTEAKLQVELASLTYEAAHLVQAGGASKGRDRGYDRQRGGLGAVGGSGEKALETRRRLLRDRMAEVNRKLKDVERRRGFQRGARNRRLEPTVALVGYTNVGKSSLLNELALSRHSVGNFFDGDEGSWAGREEEERVGESHGRTRRGTGKGMVHARNRVFDTLDPTVRSITLPSRARCVLVDTVGFIQDLPTDLVHAFRATLEEVKRADLLLHVRDASVAPHVSEAQREAVEDTLRVIGAQGMPTLEVWNKVDRGACTSWDADAVRNTGGDRAEEIEGYGVCLRDEERGNALGDMSLPDERASRRGEEGKGTGVMAASAALASDDSSRDLAGTDHHIGDDRESARGQDPAVSRGTRPLLSKGPLSDDALCVSAATGEGLGTLLKRIDALLHLNLDNRRFAPRPLDQYRYVRVLPGQ